MNACGHILSLLLFDGSAQSEEMVAILFVVTAKLLRITFFTFLSVLACKSTIRNAIACDWTLSLKKD